jgi:hypothetical protein
MSNYQVGRLMVDLNSGQLTGSMTAGTHAACPPAHANCDRFSNPVLSGDIFWQNRAFRITTGAIPAPGLLTAVQLVPALQQSSTGFCAAGSTTPPAATGTPTAAYYWDIGVYGDSTNAPNSGSGFRLFPSTSTLTSVAGYGSTATGGASNNRATDPAFGHQYCNGSRVPPEIVPTLCAGPNGNANAQGCVQPGLVGISLTVPPGITDSVYAGPAFSLTPAATVDEGSNWINMFYGPLTLTCPIGGTGASAASCGTGTGSVPFGGLLGNYQPAATTIGGARFPAPYPNP